MRFLNVRDLLAKTSLSKRYIYRLIAAGSFPQPVKIGIRSVWPEAEVDEWMAARVAERVAA